MEVLLGQRMLCGCQHVLLGLLTATGQRETYGAAYDADGNDQPGERNRSSPFGESCLNCLCAVLDHVNPVQGVLTAKHKSILAVPLRGPPVYRQKQLDIAGKCQ